MTGNPAPLVVAQDAARTIAGHLAFLAEAQPAARMTPRSAMAGMAASPATSPPRTVKGSWRRHSPGSSSPISPRRPGSPGPARSAAGPARRRADRPPGRGPPRQQGLGRVTTVSRTAITNRRSGVEAGSAWPTPGASTNPALDRAHGPGNKGETLA